MNQPITRSNLSVLTTPANALTTFRIVATPFFLIALAKSPIPSWVLCAAWFVISITDFFDGKIARKLGPTKSGAYLDPLADKISVLGALIVLVARNEFAWFPVALIAVREVAMSMYRTRVAAYGVSVPARMWGKVKAWAQALAIGLVLFPPTADNLPWLANAMLWVGVVLAYISGAQYFRSAIASTRRPRVA